MSKDVKQDSLSTEERNEIRELLKRLDKKLDEMLAKLDQKV